MGDAPDVPLLMFIDAQFELRDRALRIQAAEYERRLGDLNHEHARAQETARTYVTLDKYEAAIRAEIDAREAALTRSDERLALMALDLAELKTFRANTAGDHKDVEDLKAFKSKVLGITAVAAPLLLLAGGVVGRLLG